MAAKTSRGCSPESPCVTIVWSDFFGFPEPFMYDTYQALRLISSYQVVVQAIQIGRLGVFLTFRDALIHLNEGKKNRAKNSLEQC